MTMRTMQSAVAGQADRTDSFGHGMDDSRTCAQATDSVAASSRLQTVVIGIGNNLLGDDGAGVHVIERLRQRNRDDSIEFIDGGTLSFSLLEPVEEARQLIVVDAAYLDSAPGTVRVFRNDELEEFLTTSARPSVHEVNLLDVLGAARLRGNLPSDCALVAIEPQMVDWSAEPSPAVASAIDEACERVLELIEGEQA